MKKLMVINNNGYSSSYGLIKTFLNIGDIVDFVYQDGCCYKIMNKTGETFTLNMDRFVEAK